MTKGFWLSIDLLHDKNTTMQEKLLLIEINQLSMLDKGCIASNSHFAEVFKVKKESISRSLSSLENKGYITTKIKDGSRNHDRTITINKMLFEYKQNVIDPLTNCLESKENKTINTSYDEYLNLWNEFATKNNKPKIAKLSDSRKKKIALRLKEYKNLLEIFKFVLVKSEKSNFLLNGDFYTFDWLVENDTNILKVYEGKYDNKKNDLQEVIL